MALLRLPAPSLRGTFSKAYSLLTRLVSQIGWDELLRTRSSVFVMEEEYRQQKAKPDVPTNASSTDAQSPASDKAIYSRNSSEAGSVDKGKETSNGLETPTEIPTIKISSESDRDQEELEMANAGLNLQNVSVDVESRGPIAESPAEAGAETTASNGFAPDGDMTPKLEKPELAQHPADDKESGADAAEGANHVEEATNDPEPDDKFSFSTKRLCERWLDNLFMVLYEVCPLPCLLLDLSRLVLTWPLRCSPRISESTPSGELRSHTSRRNVRPEQFHLLACRVRANAPLSFTRHVVPQDGHGVGDPRRPCSASAAQGGGQGRLSAVPRLQVFGKVVAEAARDVRGRGRPAEDAERRYAVDDVQLEVRVSPLRSFLEGSDCSRTLYHCRWYTESCYPTAVGEWPTFSAFSPPSRLTSSSLLFFL